VADVAGDSQGVGVQINSLPVIAQAEVAEPQVAQVIALALAVAESRSMAIRADYWARPVSREVAP